MKSGFDRLSWFLYDRNQCHKSHPTFDILDQIIIIPNFTLMNGYGKISYNISHWLPSRKFKGVFEEKYHETYIADFPQSFLGKNNEFCL